jgi:hypothetical protein
LSRGKKRVRRSREDLERQLREQVGFIRTSNRLFDEGDKSEGKRLANALRVLLYDGGQSRSLLGQLGMLGLRFVNTNLRFNPKNLLAHHGLLVLHMQQQPAENIAAAFEPRCIARPDIQPGYMPFELWWEKDPVLVDVDRTEICRADIVRFVANQDGGSHVDPALDQVYHALSRGASHGWTVTGPAGEHAVDDPTPACLRQIAHEVLVTLENPKQASPFDRETMYYPRYVGDGRNAIGLR